MAFPGFHLRETDLDDLTEKFNEIAASFRQANVLNLKEEIESVSLAISGTDHRFDKGLLPGILNNSGLEIKEKTLFLHGVAEAYHRAIFGARPGILLRAGTGFSVFGTDSSGKRALASALTSVIGAPGSSYTLGVEVFHIVKHIFDGVATSLEKDIGEAAMRQFKLKKPVDFIEAVYNIRIAKKDLGLLEELSSLSGIVFEKAGEGNKLAHRMIDGIAAYQIESATRIISLLSFGESFPVVFAGSLFQSHPALAARVFSALRKRHSHASYYASTDGCYLPVIGAATLAFCPYPRRFRTTKRAAHFLSTLADLDSERRRELLWTPVNLQPTNR